MPKKKSTSCKSARKSSRLQSIKEKLKETYEELQVGQDTSLKNCKHISASTHIEIGDGSSPSDGDKGSANSISVEGNSSTNSSLELRQAFETIKSMGLSPNIFETDHSSSNGLENEKILRACEQDFSHGGLEMNVQNLEVASNPTSVKVQSFGHGEAQGFENVPHNIAQDFSHGGFVHGKQDFLHEAMEVSSLSTNKHSASYVGKEFLDSNACNLAKNACSYVVNGTPFSAIALGKKENSFLEQKELKKQVEKVENDVITPFSHAKDANAKEAHLLSPFVGQNPNLNFENFPSLQMLSPGRIQHANMEGQVIQATSLPHVTLAATSANAATCHADVAPIAHLNEAYNLHNNMVQAPQSNSKPSRSYEAKVGMHARRIGKNFGRNFAPTSCAPTTNWSALFVNKISDKLKLQEFPSEFIDGKKVVHDPPKEVFEDGEKFWRFCLVGQFLGKPPPFFLIKNMVELHWKRFGKVEIKSNGDGLFVFKFENEEACNGVLEQLWHVNHRPLLLRRWEPNMKFVNFASDKVPLWVKFRNVPLSLWTQRGLGYVATHIGVPLQMDASTEKRNNLAFARVCVEMNLEEELPDKFNVKLLDGSFAEILVEYAWKPTKCNLCKMVGHVDLHCPLHESCDNIKHVENKGEEPGEEPTQSKAPYQSEWKIVQKKANKGKDVASTSQTQANLPSKIGSLNKSSNVEKNNWKKPASPQKRGSLSRGETRTWSCTRSAPVFNNYDALNAILGDDCGEPHEEFDRQLEEFMGGPMDVKE